MAHPETNRVEKSWAVTVAVTAIIFNMCISSSLAIGGPRVAYRDGRFDLNLAGWLFVIPWLVGMWKIIEQVFISS